MNVDASMSREQLGTLAHQISDLSLRIDIAKHSLLTHLRTFDAHDGWNGMGFIATAAWLSWWIHIGPGPGAAREHVRVARALGDLKLIDAAFADGKLSYAKVRAITRVATPQTARASESRMGGDVVRARRRSPRGKGRLGRLRGNAARP
jgi:hypothetical protein